ncbi:GNAT family N-acetyltransferase [Tropicimonas isoalkanivorans]|uniref:L-ornithine N(alpha)-acyltransferase n=1 Tax=Tropicimonas isoalkanivorans TaxID=441112 RepID=A0A1I1DA75_9RHOB|nr:GNAT family N-acyltransferase [Tropicimonas isoalkanivorans]SFB71714.1 ornithine-acyl[acyl carrier protein] N-acyltransferase [Tropicimonas isoalkanivorans]
MTPEDSFLQIRLAETDQDRLAAQRLRYAVFVEELGGDGALVDHGERLERDRFDPYYDQLVLVDRRRDAAALDHVVGVYRLMPGDRAAAAGGFYCAGEYDLSPLIASNRRLLELGRSCIHPDYRGGNAMFLLWNGLGRYAVERDIEILFGVASFHGTDVQALAQPLSRLHHSHLAPPELRVRALTDHYVSMDILPEDVVDRPAAVRAIPALIKGYLRLGGYVGDGAFIDHAFNTTDVCLVMDTERLTAKQRALYTGGQG